MTYEELIDLLKKDHPEAKAERIFAHGRLEIIGNHTDHNHGKCLVGACSMGIFGAVAKNDSNVVEIHSKGFPAIILDANDVEKRDSEKGTSVALVRGVLKGFLDNGYKVGGFFLYVDSSIFEGAGVSSSACYESLICKALNHLYNSDSMPRLLMAKISQFSEREYFGKPCGMLDQIGACYEGICYLDFNDVSNPIIKPVDFNLPLKIVLVNTFGNHASLTHLYASIPEDMKSVAKEFNVDFLREISKETFESKKDSLTNVSPLAVKRAIHFFNENERVEKAYDALVKEDLTAFLEEIKSTQESSCNFLENTQVPGTYAGSPQEAVDYANKFIKNGAARIMGGGFAGSILCFVDPNQVNDFKAYMAKKYGEERVVEVFVPQTK